MIFKIFLRFLEFYVKIRLFYVKKLFRSIGPRCRDEKLDFCCHTLGAGYYLYLSIFTIIYILHIFGNDVISVGREWGGEMFTVVNTLSLVTLVRNPLACSYSQRWDSDYCSSTLFVCVCVCVCACVDVSLGHFWRGNSFLFSGVAVVKMAVRKGQKQFQPKMQ